MVNGKYNTLEIMTRYRNSSHRILNGKILVPNNLTARVRFGNVIPAFKNYDIEINSIKAIKNTSNKITMKTLFKEAEVSSPEFLLINNDSCTSYDGELSFDEVVNKYFNNNKVLIAKRDRRSKGVGMKKITNSEDWYTFLKRFIIDNNYNLKNSYYLEVYANYSKEYRIHVSEAGGYFYTNRKMLKTNADNRWFRNDSNCVWILEHNELFNKPNTWNQIVEDCQKAREALGMSICGFDVRVNKQGKWSIIEANSACSFGDKSKVSYVASLYLTELSKIINKNMFNV